MKATVLFIGMFLMTNTFVFAGNGDNLVDRIMHRKISYPEALRAKGIEATVSVKLRVVNGGKVEIVDITSDSEEMKAAVAQQVERLKFRAPSNLVGEEFDYTFKFQVQK